MRPVFTGRFAFQGHWGDRLGDRASSYHAIGYACDDGPTSIGAVRFGSAFRFVSQLPDAGAPQVGAGSFSVARYPVRCETRKADPMPELELTAAQFAALPEREQHTYGAALQVHTDRTLRSWERRPCAPRRGLGVRVHRGRGGAGRPASSPRRASAPPGSDSDPHHQRLRGYPRRNLDELATEARR
jgi:hypothetical protein